MQNHRILYGGSKIMNIHVENGKAIGAEMRPINPNTFGRDSDVAVKGSAPGFGGEFTSVNGSRALPSNLNNSGGKPYTSLGFRNNTPTPSFIVNQLAFVPLAGDNTPGARMR